MLKKKEVQQDAEQQTAQQSSQEKKNIFKKIRKPKQPKQKKVKQKPEKQKTVKAVKQKSDKKNTKPGVSIKVQLVIGFLIPIFCTVAVGWISYSKASQGLVANYESSSITALDMTMNSLDESMKNISSITMELAQDQTIFSYALGGYDDDTAQQSKVKTTIKNNLNVKETAGTMIQNIHIIPVETDKVITTKTLNSDNDMDSFITELASSEDKDLLNGKMVHWGSYHPFIDSKMGTDGYVMFASRAFNSGKLKGLVVIDVSTQAVKDLLNRLEFGEGSYVSFITSDGAEVSTNPDFSVNSVEGVDWEKRADYIEYNGTTYFYMTASSTVTGGKVLALVPKAYITQSSQDIRNITVAMVLVVCLISAVIGLIIITGISRNISKSIKRLGKVSEGDLTLHNGKKDKPARNEFGKLHSAMNNTVNTMRGLLSSVAEMKDQVLASGDMVMESGIELGNMTENVSAQIEEIDSIIATQNEKISDCNEQMEELSVKIKSVSGSISAAIDGTSSSMNTIEEGKATVNEMVSQSSQTAEATKDVQEHVAKLADKLSQIGTFVTNIQDIAEQTNLLSLNASIEAARAGEQGRGFSVVAEEIRKLADSSGETAAEIQKIIEEIVVYSQNALEKVTEAENISATQMEYADKTIHAFEQMNDIMEELVNNMMGISQEMDNMNQDRHNALKAIHSIGESSEHTVKATGEVSQYLEKQMKSSEGLKAETVKMKENMDHLEEAIQTFKL